MIGIMSNASIRVRFAPSPTGFMHLGNVRAALINYLYAQQHQGTFIIRIEDTDPQRNMDPRAQQILADLAWLQLRYQEGPIIQGPHAPYYQSERLVIYERYLQLLQVNKSIYRCFCSVEELEKKRQRQLALKQPPRYDRACLHLSSQTVQQNLDQKMPFIWRLKLPDQSITITDLARGTITYDLKHFSDAPLSRQDGTFTFIFANFVDDHAMEITQVIRGEDHLSNTAIQAALYQAFNAPFPAFWHLPIMINSEGKKLSKRDFGFSLNDLREAGFLPEAIVNYLALIGGGSVEKEVQSLEELVRSTRFEALATTGQVRYDLDKLRWFNHQWIMRLENHDLADRTLHYLKQAYPTAHIDHATLTRCISLIKTDLITLKDIVQALAYYFETPSLMRTELEPYLFTQYSAFFEQLRHALDLQQDFLSTVTRLIKEQGAPTKSVYSLLRLALTGKAQGPSIKDIFEILGHSQALERIKTLITTLRVDQANG